MSEVRSSLPSGRVEFIDLLRGWAVIVMIETHVVNATLDHDLMTGSFFNYMKFVNGLVAPSFLFASGMAYAYTTRRKIRDYLAFGAPLFKQVSRLLLILGIAYMLHLPKFSLSALLHETTPEEWQPFFQVDVLQCIAVTLLCLQGLLLVMRSEKRLYLSVCVIAVITLFVTPVMWGVDFGGTVPAALAAYLNGNRFSLFPLFPWSVFIFAGAIAGYAYTSARGKEPEGEHHATSRMMRRLLITGIVLLVAGVLIEPFAQSVYATYDYWRFSPSFVLLRVGIVMMLCWGMFLYERHRGVSPRSLVTLIGRESLLVYVLHLLLLYGDFGPFNFQKTVSHTFGYGAAAVTTIVLLVLMALLAWRWSRIKKESPRLRRTISLATLAGLVLVFVFGPGQ